EFVEAEQRGLVGDLVGGELDRIAVHPLTGLLLRPETPYALMHVGHEFVEMRAALAHDGRSFEEEVHQHGLAAADIAPEIKPLRRNGGLPCHQPAERARLC